MRPETRPTRYDLEIHEPGSIDDVARSFSSPTPFMPLAEGDLISEGFFPNERPGFRYRVMKVEHIFWEAGDHNVHRLSVYTEEIDEDEAFSWHS